MRFVKRHISHSFPHIFPPSFPNLIFHKIHPNPHDFIYFYKYDSFFILIIIIFWCLWFPLIRIFSVVTFVNVFFPIWFSHHLFIFIIIIPRIFRTIDLLEDFHFSHVTHVFIFTPSFSPHVITISTQLFSHTVSRYDTLQCTFPRWLINQPNTIERRSKGQENKAGPGIGRLNPCTALEVVLLLKCKVVSSYHDHRNQNSIFNTRNTHTHTLTHTGPYLHTASLIYGVVLLKWLWHMLGIHHTHHV